jgi:hypothetical protein
MFVFPSQYYIKLEDADARLNATEGPLECAWLSIPGESPWQQKREVGGGEHFNRSRINWWIRAGTWTILTVDRHI